jgi:hypothetical protein
MERSNCATAYLGFGRIHFNIAASDAQEPLSLFTECAVGSFDMSDATRIPVSHRMACSRPKQPKPIVEISDDRRPSRDLALDQPEKWLRAELVINLQTAKVLGLDVPPMLLACTDEVIE